MRRNFTTAFLEELTADEQALLFAVLNNNRENYYCLEWAIAPNLITKLSKVPLNEEGNKIKESIVEKYTKLS
jgi:hypothetical protein